MMRIKLFVPLYVSTLYLYLIKPKSFFLEYVLLRKRARGKCPANSKQDYERFFYKRYLDRY